ncbi:hypothetical protein GDO78_023212, partial [Eleutherodactylus coqui]
ELGRSLRWIQEDNVKGPLYVMIKLFNTLCISQFHVQKVVPQADASSSKVKVKVRVNVHGIFSVSSASLVEVHKTEDGEEPMETDQAGKDEEKMQVDQEEAKSEENQSAQAENKPNSEEMEVLYAFY